MKVDLYTMKGEKAGTIEVSDAIFAHEWNADLVHQAIIAQQANARRPWAHAKGRGEVSGGGKKPWKQKGTGRARHGSIRSPIWKGGGVTFGPLSIRNYKTKINKKIKNLALRMCLSDRAENKSLLVVEDFNFAEPKTKLFTQFMSVLPVKAKSILVLTPGKNEQVLRMTKNIKAVKTVRAEDVNVMDVLANSIVVTNKAGVEKLETVLNKNK